VTASVSLSLLLVRCAHFLDVGVHRGIGRQQVGEHRQQAVFEALHLAAANVEVHHAEELAVGAGIGDQGDALGVLDLDRLRHAVVGVAAEDGIDAGDAAGHLEVDVHAVVRQYDHDFGTLGTRFIDPGLHAVVADAEAPVRHHVARVGDRCVGESLADDGDLHPVHFLHRVGLEHLVAEVVGDDVLRDEIDVGVLEILVDDFHHPFGAEGRLPVRGHDIDAELDAGVDHVLRVAPQRGGGALPGVAAVQQQGAGALCANLVDQGFQVGETADLAVDLGGFGEVEVGEGMGLGATGLDAVFLQQMLADQMRHLAEGSADAKVDVGLAEPHRQQLGVTVGEVHEGDIAVARNIVEVGGGFARQCRLAVDCHAGRGGDGQQLQKLATVHVHGVLLRDFGLETIVRYCRFCRTAGK